MFHFTIGVDKKVSCDTYAELMEAMGSNGMPKARAKPTAGNPAEATDTTETDEQRIAKLPFETGRMHWRTQKKLMAEHNYTDPKLFAADMKKRRAIGR